MPEHNNTTMKLLEQIVLFIQHRLRARNVKGFGIHSPFLFGFVQQVIRNKHPYYCFSRLESIRAGLLSSQKTIEVEDLGTGKSGTKQVAKIAKRCLASPKSAQMLFRIIRYVGARNVLELGTSLGVTTAYLASPSRDIQCTTIEGSASLVNMAKQTAEKANLNNIRFLEGDIASQLPHALSAYGPFDCIYFDANHTFVHTLQYFEMCVAQTTEQSVFIFDDIHISFEMKQAWQWMLQHEKVTASIELNRFGILFFDRNLKKRTYYL